MAFLPSGQFLPTTQVWDISTIPAGEQLKGDELRELIVRLYQHINNIAVTVNNKEGGQFAIANYITGDQYYPRTGNQALRDVVRTVVNVGQLPNTGTINIAHNIPWNSQFTLVRLYGAATDTIGLLGIPLPYASTVPANSIELGLTSTNVVITTGVNRTNFNVCSVVIEYLML